MVGMAVVVMAREQKSVAGSVSASRGKHEQPRLSSETEWIDGGTGSGRILTFPPFVAAAVFLSSASIFASSTWTAAAILGSRRTTVAKSG